MATWIDVGRNLIEIEKLVFIKGKIVLLEMLVKHSNVIQMLAVDCVFPIFKLSVWFFLF